jgi:putative resolvase
VVADDAEMTDDLVQDMIDVMTSFCARICGRRSAGRCVLGSVSAPYCVAAARYPAAG